MMFKTKTILLTLLLTIGFTFQNCDSLNCNCPPFEGDYFDIQGMEVVNYTTTSGDVIQENQEVEFPFYGSLALNFEVDYIASNVDYQPTKAGFSLMSTAYGCSCLWNGGLGSKEERIESLTILTLNDFDDEHQANESINDILEVRNGSKLTLEEYLVDNNALVEGEQFELDLMKAPELNEEFKVKVILELSTGERYEGESLPFIIK